MSEWKGLKCYVLYGAWHTRFFVLLCLGLFFLLLPWEMLEETPSSSWTSCTLSHTSNLEAPGILPFSVLQQVKCWKWSTELLLALLQPCHRRAMFLLRHSKIHFQKRFFPFSLHPYVFAHSLTAQAGLEFMILLPQLSKGLEFQAYSLRIS